MAKDWTKADAYGGLSLVNRRFMDIIKSRCDAFLNSMRTARASSAAPKISWDRTENFFAPDLHDKVLQEMLIDAEIFNQETDRLMGYGYPYGDPRNDFVRDTLEVRVKHLRNLFRDDLESANPRYADWHNPDEAALIIERAYLRQHDMLEAPRALESYDDQDELIHARTVQELVTRLTHLPPYQESQRAR